MSTEPHQQASILTRITCLLLGHKGCRWAKRLRQCDPPIDGHVLVLSTGERRCNHECAVPVVREVGCVCERCGTLYAVKVN